MAISQKQVPTDKGDRSRASHVVEALNAVYPLMNNAVTFRCGGRCIRYLRVAGGLLLLGVQMGISYRADFNLGSLWRQKPNPLTSPRRAHAAGHFYMRGSTAPINPWRGLFRATSGLTDCRQSVGPACFPQILALVQTV